MRAGPYSSERAFDCSNVRSAEQIHVHHQKVKLVERDASLVARRQFGENPAKSRIIARSTSCTAGSMTILAAITKPEAIRRILDHLGIPSAAPRLTSARPPPQTNLSRTSDLAEIDYADPPSPAR